MTRTITIIPAVLLLVATATSVQAQAPSNNEFAATQYNDHTYQLLFLGRNHEEALLDVAEHAAWNTGLPNPYLLQLTTLSEKNFLQAWLADINASSISLWHGAEDSDFEGTWVYADGPAYYERDRSLFGANCPNGVCWNPTGFWEGGGPAIPSNDCMVFSDSSSQFRDETCDLLTPTHFVVLENGQTCRDYQTDGNPNLCPAVDYEEKPDFASIVCDNNVQLCSQTTCCVYVPEPSAGLMLSTGALLLTALRRLRRRAG
jgi:hypothetical protein